MTLTAQRLQEVLTYEPESGHFIRNFARKGYPKGSIAGSTNREGYVVIRIDGRAYQSHRLAFLYMLGHFPERQVDHINGMRDDNRWKNLRDADQSTNSQNKQPHGVTFSKGRWVARIFVAGRRIYLGRFVCHEEARKVYLNAKRQLHPGFNA